MKEQFITHASASQVFAQDCARDFNRLCTIAKMTVHDVSVSSDRFAHLHVLSLTAVPGADFGASRISPNLPVVARGEEIFPVML